MIMVGNNACAEYTDYNVPIAIKNISGAEIGTLTLTGFWSEGKVSLSRPYTFQGSLFPVSTISEPGKFYSSPVTIGKTDSDKEIPAIPLHLGIQVKKNDGTFLGRYIGGGTHPGWRLIGGSDERASVLHYVIIPGGNVVRIPQIFDAGGAVTVDHYIIHADGSVTREGGLPCQNCTPPAGKTNPTIDEQGNLAWQ